MHANKAEALKKLAESSGELDAEINRLKDIVRNPNRDGWESSLKALATLPFLGVGAVIADASEILIRSISDDRWDDSPKGNAPEPPTGDL